MRGSITGRDDIPRKKALDPAPNATADDHGLTKGEVSMAVRETPPSLDGSDKWGRPTSM